MHKHFDVLTTSSPLSFCENEVSSQSTHFHKLFCFQQFGIFNREKKKKRTSENQLHLQMLRKELHSFKMQFPLDPSLWF